MVSLSALSPGTRVRIVSEWNDYCCQNQNGEMDQYLGTVMTVRGWKNRPSSVAMVEDGGRWAWVKEAIECIVSDNPEIETDDIPSDFTFGDLKSMFG